MPQSLETEVSFLFKDCENELCTTAPGRNVSIIPIGA